MAKNQYLMKLTSSGFLLATTFKELSLNCLLIWFICIWLILAWFGFSMPPPQLVLVKMCCAGPKMLQKSKNVISNLLLLIKSSVSVKSLSNCW